MNVDMDVDVDPLALTAGAATAISEDRFHNVDDDTLQMRLVMQVVGIARLKYTPHGNFNPEAFLKDPREMFKERKVVSFSDDGEWPHTGPLRLQLSDGANIVAGKFHPESPKLRDFRIHSKVNQLMSEGQLKEGSIIRFQPYNHVASGSGLVSIFHMEAVGWSEIIGGPRPCHEGVQSFSPRPNGDFRMHHCTIPATVSLLEKSYPIDWASIFLTRVIKDTIGYCTVSGSAALAEYLHSLPGCGHCYEKSYGSAIGKLCAKGDFSKDVDLFVPQYPEALNHFYQTEGTKVANLGTKVDVEFIEGTILSALFSRYGIRHTKVACTKVCLYKLEKMGPHCSAQDDMRPYFSVDREERMEDQEGTTMDYGWMRIFIGLKYKLDFHLVSSTGQFLSAKPIQILIVDAFPLSPSQSWDELVVNGFDTDIIKCIAQIGSSPDNNRIDKVTFSEGALENLKKGRFEYTMRPCHSFPQMLKRLTKYAERGFRLHKFSFDARVSQEWRDYILHEFRLEYSERWLKEWADAAGMSIDPGKALRDCIDGHIMPFLGRHSEESRSEQDIEYEKKVRQAENRAMLRRNILAELDRTDNYDPGYNEIDRQALLNLWHLIDQERIEQEAANLI